MKSFNISEEQFSILDHTLYRAAGQRYCGSGMDMEALCIAGYMKPIGKPDWAIDAYYAITEKGKQAHSLMAAFRGKLKEEKLKEYEKTLRNFWAGPNEEKYYVGPCDSPEQAISEFESDYAEEILRGEYRTISIGSETSIPTSVCGQSFFEDYVERQDNVYEDFHERVLNGIKKEDYENLGNKISEVLTQWVQDVCESQDFVIIEHYKYVNLPSRKEEVRYTKEAL